MNILIPFDEKIVSKVDALTSDRVGFIQKAVLAELKRSERRRKGEDIDKRLVEAYARQPQMPEEYEVWQNEQVWED